MSNLYNKDKSRWSNHRRAILKRLRQNDPILTHLNLGGNRITKEGATALAEALKTNTVLTTLYLGGNQITNEGATALAEALKINTVLMTLNLRWGWSLLKTSSEIKNVAPAQQESQEEGRQKGRRTGAKTFGRTRGPW